MSMVLCALCCSSVSGELFCWSYRLCSIRLITSATAFCFSSISCSAISSSSSTIDTFSRASFSWSKSSLKSFYPNCSKSCILSCSLSSSILSLASCFCFHFVGFGSFSSVSISFSNIHLFSCCTKLGSGTNSSESTDSSLLIELGGSKTGSFSY